MPTPQISYELLCWLSASVEDLAAAVDNDQAAAIVGSIAERTRAELAPKGANDLVFDPSERSFPVAARRLLEWIVATEDPTVVRSPIVQLSREALALWKASDETKPVDPVRSERARRGWETSRRNTALRAARDAACSVGTHDGNPCVNCGFEDYARAPQIPGGPEHAPKEG